MHDVVIRGGIVVTPSGLVAFDIAIDGGVIASIGQDAPAGREEIHARSLHVLPGIIDDHVHFNEPGNEGWEGAATGSRALAAGGGTVYFDMPLNSVPCTITAKEFDRKHAALKKASVTDFALWGGLIPGSIPAMAELAECGVIGFKAFLCNSGLPEFPRADDLTLYEGMKEAARLNLPLAVHAESEEITSILSRRKIQSGHTSARDYLESRPVTAEVEAIQRAALIARDTGARLQIVHVSSGSGVAAALQARAQGTDITIETCPHYLHFTEEDLERIGAAAKCAPPLRNAAERDSLRAHLKAGHVDIVASDHSPAPPPMKTGGDFFAIWGGIAGVQSTLAVLLGGGVSLPDIASLTACNPAKKFNLVQKAALPGSDADFCLVDLNLSRTLDSDDLHQRHKFSPYIGARFPGVVRRTILRGRTIFAEGAFLTESGGQLIRPAIPTT